MINIADTRTYFDDRIKSIDANYIFIDDPFGDDTISENYGDKNYKLWFGEVSRERNASSWAEIVPVTVEIYSEECRDNTGAFDSVYQKALDMSDAITDPKCIETTDLTDIVFISASPSPVESNDKMVKITLSFSVFNDFKFC